VAKVLACPRLVLARQLSEIHDLLVAAAKPWSLALPPFCFERQTRASEMRRPTGLANWSKIRQLCHPKKFRSTRLPHARWLRSRERSNRRLQPFSPHFLEYMPSMFSPSHRAEDSLPVCGRPEKYECPDVWPRRFPHRHFSIRSLEIPCSIVPTQPRHRPPA